MSYGPPPPPGYNPMQQPMGQPMGPKPDSYLVWSILVTLFCCLPFGIAAIISSTKVDSLYNSGQYAQAAAASASAKKWNIWGAVSAVVILVLYVVFVVVLGVASSSTS